MCKEIREVKYSALFLDEHGTVFEKKFKGKDICDVTEKINKWLETQYGLSVIDFKCENKNVRGSVWNMTP